VPLPLQRTNTGIRPIPPASVADVLAVFNRNPIYLCLFGEDELGEWTAHNGIPGWGCDFGVRPSSIPHLVMWLRGIHSCTERGRLVTFWSFCILDFFLQDYQTCFSLWDCRLSTIDVGL
jgi:hypothetical protein